MRPVEATDEALLAGTCVEPLPDSAGRGGGDGFSAAEAPDAAGRFPAGWADARKETALGSPTDGVVHGVYMLALFLPCCSRPCNSFFASIAN